MKAPDANEIHCRQGVDALRTQFDNAQGHADTSHRGNGKSREPLILSTTEFVSGFTPPDYLIEGLLQRRFLYSMTAPTGAGKTAITLRICTHVALGLPLAGHQIDCGKVLFFAGENPDDVRMRWIRQMDEMKIAPSDCNVFWRPGGLNLSDHELQRRLNVETKRNGPFVLIIVDTSAAYFTGNDENSNVEMGAHARMLRRFVEVSGGPTVLVTCHPTKNADQGNLLPRGGGAFIAEVDGNLVCLKSAGNHIVELHWQGKFRGPDFAPISFIITPGTTPKLVDSKGRPIFTVTARPISEAEVSEADAAARDRQDRLLEILEAHPRASLADLGRILGWFYRTGEPNKTLVNRTLDALKARSLVKKESGEWVVTQKGGGARKRRSADETAEAAN
jgi:AAA domain